MKLKLNKNLNRISILLFIAFFLVNCKNVLTDRERSHITGLSEPEPVLGSTIPGLCSDCGDELISLNGCNGKTSIGPSPESINHQHNSSLSVDYGLVEISGMCWFADNLKEVPSSFNPSPVWVNNSNNGWNGYYLNAGNESNPGVGALYTFAAAMNDPLCAGVSSLCDSDRRQGICPMGFHIPSDCELGALESFLGHVDPGSCTFGYRSTVAVGVGQQMITTGTSGFNLQMAGYRRFPDGTWGNINRSMLWTSTQLSVSESVRRYINLSSVGVNRQNIHKGEANSVRCVKD